MYNKLSNHRQQSKLSTAGYPCNPSITSNSLPPDHGENLSQQSKSKQNSFPGPLNQTAK